jgi:hypothetical protein
VVLGQILHLSPCTLHLTPYTFHLTPYTSHPALSSAFDLGWQPLPHHPAFAIGEYADGVQRRAVFDNAKMWVE